MSRASVALAALVCVLCVALSGASQASAAFGVSEFDVAFENADGTAVTEAGSHPFQMATTLELNTVFSSKFGADVPDGALREVVTELPVGMAGDPFAVPRCSGADFAAVNRQVVKKGGEDFINETPACPNNTAVGTVAAAAVQTPPRLYFHQPVFNLVPPPGYAAKLGFVVQQVPIVVLIGLREDKPNRVYAVIRNTSQVLYVYGAKLRIWGNPSDQRHDEFRGECVDTEATASDETPSLGDCEFSGDARPFLTMPTACAGPLKTDYVARPWLASESSVSGTAESHDDAVPPNPVSMSGCGGLKFDPTVQSRLSSSETTSPAGMEFDIDLQDTGLTDPERIAKSTLEMAVVTLPQGITVNPSQAEGLGTCSQADLGRERADSDPGEGCPLNSKIGTVEVQTPILEGRTLKGSLFVATPYENRFGTLIALYMVFRDPELGIVVRQEGKVIPDPVTGQLTATFDEVPPLPFSHLSVHFRSGARSALVTPAGCGTYKAQAQFTPSADPGFPYPAEAEMTVSSGPGGGPCPTGVPPLSPSFSAGTLNNAAGSYSPLFMRIQRSDAEQEIRRFSSILPPGLTGKLAGVERCSDAAIAAAASKTGTTELVSPSCPVGSRIGSVVGGAGVGSALTYVGGSLYMAGPYAGNPLSLVAIVPAVAGPFDVGTVVTRVGLSLNPVTAQVEVDGAASDPIPRILAGIPLHLRDLQISVDRPEFTLNATSCEPKTVSATVFGNVTLAGVADRYQAASCASLGYKPKLWVKLRGATKRTGHPAIRAVVTPRPGDANIGGSTVILPKSTFLDALHVRTTCTRDEWAADSCPKAAIYGRARAFTPLLDEPLEGPVYLRSNGGARELPDLVADLRGIVDIELVGFIDSVNERMRTRFQSVPDAPVTKFVLNMQGGKKGLLQNSEDLCKGEHRIAAFFNGQNGRRLKTRPAVKTDCRKHKKKSAKHRRR